MIFRDAGAGRPRIGAEPFGARFRKLGLQETSFAHMGMELSQEQDYPVRLTQPEFASNLAPVEASPALWAARQRLLFPEDVLRRQCKLGGLCWRATASAFCPKKLGDVLRRLYVHALLDSHPK